MTAITGLPVYDPAPLNAVQRTGDACVSCDKRWPRPRLQVGTVPGGDPVRCCAECIVLLQRSAEACR